MSGVGRSLGTRLLLAQGVVLVAAAVTAVLVAAAVGPPLFHQHLVEAGHPYTDSDMAHIEQAYTSASAVALGAAMVIALTAAVAVTWYLRRRVTGPLTVMARAATRLSHGDYTARVPVLGAGPELDALASTLNDAAARLQATEETRRSMLADLAHEMRTPLATIGAYLDGLEDGVTSWDADSAGVLRAHTSRLTRLAEDIGAVSRAQEHQLGLTLAPTPVAEILDAAAQTVREGYAGKGVALVAGPREDGPDAVRRPVGSLEALVAVDRDRIVQVLTNLLTNALRHTSPGGTVTLDATCADGTATFTVTDDGEGITAEQLPHVFERFYRGDTARTRERSGSGIGLTIARSIAADHDGTLVAHSDGPGRGASFALTLPIRPAH